MTTTRENAHGDRPGALRSQAIMEIQTRQAQRLVYGRRPEGDKPTIVGLLRFATMLRPIWTGAAADDPYADWWLVQVERELLQGREHLEALREHVDRLLKSAPAVDVKLAQSLEPVRVDLNFSSPYAFMGAYLLADYDALVRAILTGRHVGLLDRSTAEKLLRPPRNRETLRLLAFPATWRLVRTYPAGSTITPAPTQPVREGNGSRSCIPARGRCPTASARAEILTTAGRTADTTAPRPS